MNCSTLSRSSSARLIFLGPVNNIRMWALIRMGALIGMGLGRGGGGGGLIRKGALIGRKALNRTIKVF